MLQSARPLRIAVNHYLHALHILFAVLLSTLIPCNQASAMAVGSVPGSLSVSPSGAARYSVPLEIPPGIAGMQPELSLGYDSQAGNGLLGVGWSLSGLSTIYRCPATLAQDGFIDPVDFDTNDRYCLDGQRLVAAGNTGCTGGTEYRTEIDTYARICAFGVRGSGPASFRVWTKSGQIMDYGKTPDSRVEVTGRSDLAAWVISAASDTVGNSVRYMHAGNSSTGTHKPVRIRYTENIQAGMNAVAEIVFQYENRPDSETGYASSARTTIADRLSGIVVRVADKVISRYRLDYTTSSASGRSKLIRITHCDAANNCREPLDLGWQTGESRLEYSGQGSGGTHAFWNKVVGNATYKGKTFTGDFNGDGRTDLMMIYRDPNLDKVSIYHWNAAADGKLAYAGRGSGGTHAWWNKVIDSDKYKGRAFTGDFNGDGRTDLMMVYRDPGLNEVSIYHWQADKTGKLAYVGRGSGGTHAYWNIVLGNSNYGGKAFTGDFNGDGRTDLMMAYRDSNLGQVSIYHWQANKNGKLAYVGRGSGGTHANWNKVIDSDKYKGRAFTGDFNGDGQTDLMMIYRDPGLGEVSIYHWQADKTGKLAYVGRGAGGTHAYWNAVVGNNKFRGKAFTGDFNGDGRTDLMMIYRDPGLNTVSIYHWHAMEDGRLGYAGRGSGGTHAYWDKVLDSNTYEGRAFTGDFNGDGKTDLSMVYRDPNLSTLSIWHWQAGTSGKLEYVGKGVGGTSVRWDKVLDNETYRGDAFVGDFNGDSKSDLMLVYRDPGRSSVSIYHWAMDRKKSDLLVTVNRKKRGTVEKFSYGLLTDTAVHRKSGDAQYPGIDLQIPLSVVESTRTSDGIGGTRTSSYKYEGLKADLQGRGLLGFRKIIAVDEQTSMVTSTLYKQLFPLTGLLESSETRLKGAARPYTRTSSSWKSVSFSNGKRREVQPVSTTERSWENDGRLVSTLITNYQSYGKYGNVLKMAVTTTAMGVSYTKTTVNSYASEDPAAWILGRLTRSEVTSSTPGDSATRTSSFGYNVATGLLTTEIVEPDSPDQRLRTAYTYGDGYGNRTVTSVSGSGNARYPISKRTTRTSHDYTNLLSGGYTYGTISTNAKNHTDRSVHDVRFGVIRSHTDINGLKISWSHDGFGRRVRELRADGTETTWKYAWCGTSCPGTSVYRITVEKTGSAPLTRYFDALDRQVRIRATGLTGRRILQDTEYDSLGRIRRESRNYFEGAPRFWTNYRYDELGRTIRVASPDGGVGETSYQGLTTVLRKFDSNGDYNQTITRTTDALGREIEVIDEAGQVLSKRYNAFGNLVETIDAAGNSTLLSYDRSGNRITMNDPDMGYWRYRYDALGQLRWQKDARNQIVQMDYDVLGRTTRRVEKEGVTTWSYDKAGNGSGKLYRVDAYDGFAQILGYDKQGRQTSDKRRLNGSWYEVNTRYDSSGRVSKLIYPGDFQLRYGYNKNGYLVSATNARVPAEVFWKADDSDADGNVVLSTLGNGLQTVRLYEPFSGRLLGISSGRGSSSDVQFMTYRYDSLGNLERRTDENRQYRENFFYDQQNRLIRMTATGEDSTAYTYDVLGNIKARGALSGYRYGENGSGPHAVTRIGGRQYSYDANGNMRISDGRKITWSSFNKPVELEGQGVSLQFSYGPGRSRYLQKKTGSSTSVTLYFDKRYEKIISNGVIEQRNYISAGGKTVALYTSKSGGGTVTRYLHQDHLGSTEVITDEFGNVVERRGYKPFGEQNNPEWQPVDGVQLDAVTTRGFTGHEQLVELGLIHMNGRVYDPEIGRFLSADPQVQFPGNMQSYNRYSYVHNNPLSYTDPSGFGLWSKVKKAVKRVAGNDWVRLGAGIAAASIVAPYAAGYFGLLSGSSAVSAVANGVAGGLALGGVTAGNVSGALLGGVQGGAFGIVGHAGFLSGIRSSVPGGSSLLHGAVGGTFRSLSGGSFREGFLSAAVTKFANANIFSTTNNVILGSVRSTIAGGLGATLGGGKFINGAQTGAFSYLFNDAFGKIQMRRVGNNIYPVRAFECATAECVAMGANLNMSDPGTQAYLRALDEKALSDLGTAASLVVLKTPVSTLGNMAARTSLAADVAKTILTGNPATIISVITGRFAQGVAETTLGISNAATVNRIGVGAGLITNKVINTYE